MPPQVLGWRIIVDGRTEKWLPGGRAIIRMAANGWTKRTVKPGDVITGIGSQFADGQKIVRQRSSTCIR